MFQKIWGRNAEALLESLTPDTTALYAQADLSPDNPLPLRCHGVIASSQALAKWHADHGVRSWWVPDPAEIWLDPRPPREGTVRLCWIAHRKNLETLEPLRALLAEPELARYELVTVSNDSAADVLWSEDAARRVLAESDVGVVPVRDAPGAALASSNRVTALMAAGLPVVADRLPAYEEVVEHGRTGYLCNSVGDWRRALSDLLDATQRRRIAAAARAAVDPAYRAETIGDQWIRLFEQLDGDGNVRLRRRLRAYAKAHENSTYARAALERYYGLPIVLGQAARAAAAAPLAPGGPAAVLSLGRDLARPVAGRVRAAVRRRLG